MNLYLIASTRLEPGYAEWLTKRGLSWREGPLSGDSARLIEFAGRVCYLSFGDRQSPKNSAEYVGHLIEQQHESVLEHASFSLLADGISRALSHQIVRHRVGFAYSQLSQQYHDEAQATFVMPFGIGESPNMANEWSKSVQASLDTYKTIEGELNASDFARELPLKERLRAIRSIARSVLPNSTATTLVITGNGRAWRHLLQVRGAIQGDKEMRDFCLCSFRLLVKAAPEIFGDFEIADDAFGPMVKRRVR